MDDLTHRNSSGSTSKDGMKQTEVITEAPRSGDAEEHGDPDSPGVFAGNDELGDCADDKTDESRPKQDAHSP